MSTNQSQKILLNCWRNIFFFCPRGSITGVGWRGRWRDNLLDSPDITLSSLPTSGGNSLTSLLLQSLPDCRLSPLSDVENRWELGAGLKGRAGGTILFYWCTIPGNYHTPDNINWSQSCLHGFLFQLLFPSLCFCLQNS